MPFGGEHMLARLSRPASSPFTTPSVARPARSRHFALCHLQPLISTRTPDEFPDPCSARNCALRCVAGAARLARCTLKPPHPCHQVFVTSDKEAERDRTDPKKILRLSCPSPCLNWHPVASSAACASAEKPTQSGPAPFLHGTRLAIWRDPPSEVLSVLPF